MIVTDGDKLSGFVKNLILSKFKFNEMGATIEIKTLFPKTFPSSKIMAVESTLQQTLTNFRDLVMEFEELYTEYNNYRSMYLSQKEKGERQICKSCEDMKKCVVTKEKILESVVSALNKLYETRDFNIINEICKLINSNINILTTPKDIEDVACQQNGSPKKVPIYDVAKDESLSEIEGTPSGRKSPIFLSNKLKNTSTNSLTFKDKKKCPNSWPTPENKSIKLTYPTTNKTPKRLKQSRLSTIKTKTLDIVDLTCSPELRSHSEVNVQGKIKKGLDNDDTILPSPTSGPIIQLPGYKSLIKESPNKFKKPGGVSNFKIELDTIDYNEENKPIGESILKEDESINILKSYLMRFKSPIKKDKLKVKIDNADDSISLLQHVKKIEEKDKTTGSPIKRPLSNNANVINTQKLPDSQSSISILQDIAPVEVEKDITKRVKTNMEPVYKETISRKKSERRALPGWSCEECKIFFDELYKDNIEMLKKKMDECSKHRGKNNPVRPKTPDGFWNPRWDVPDDTEEFNLRNNAI